MPSSTEPLHVRVHLPEGATRDDLRAGVEALARSLDLTVGACDHDHDEEIAKAIRARPEGERHHASQALRDAEDELGAAMTDASAEFQRRARAILGLE